MNFSTLSTNEQSIVKITNLLNFTRQEFDVLGQRLMVLIFEKLKHQQQFNAKPQSIELTFNFIDFQERNVERLKELADKVTSKKIFFEVAKEEWGFIVPIYYASYRNGTFKIIIAAEVSKYFLDIAGYTNLDKKAIFALSSQYSIRMYELLSAFINQKLWTIEVHNLRELLGLGHTQYKNFRHFEKYILEYSQKELAEHCDLYFTWEIAEKHRKKITALTFYIQSKEQKEKVELKEEIKQTIDFVAKLSPVEIAHTYNLITSKYHLSTKQADYIFSDTKLLNEFIRVDLIIESMIEKGKPPKDRTKYLAKSLGLDKVNIK